MPSRRSLQNGRSLWERLMTTSSERTPLEEINFADHIESPLADCRANATSRNFSESVQKLGISSQELMSEGNVDHGFGRTGTYLVVFG
jgi:hypothetical protein